MDTYIESHFAGALSYRYMMVEAFTSSQPLKAKSPLGAYGIRGLTTHYILMTPHMGRKDNSTYTRDEMPLWPSLASQSVSSSVNKMPALPPGWWKANACCSSPLSSHALYPSHADTHIHNLLFSPAVFFTLSIQAHISYWCCLFFSFFSFSFFFIIQGLHLYR